MPFYESFFSYGNASGPKSECKLRKRDRTRISDFFPEYLGLRPEISILHYSRWRCEYVYILSFYFCWQTADTLEMAVIFSMSQLTMSLLNDADKVSLYNSEPVKWRTPKIRLPTEKNVAFFASENRNCSGLHNVIYFPLAILHTPQRTRMKSSKFGGSCSSRWNIRVANRESAPGLYFGFREGKQGSA